ncbi:MAG: DUF1330 domain-containing protein [Bermanella sp.]
MKCYVITNYSIDQNKLEGYADYPQKASSITTQFGGRLLVASLNSQVVEGAPEDITVVLEFNSRELAERWYSSAEYTAIKNMRINATKAGWMILTDEFTPQ